ncbi:MAG: DUF4860 domain-containing protein [Oscillospiraceae bacterium]|nr:DUF4860 domain-containing protein [Oscillospiraceae bacterium]
MSEKKLLGDIVSVLTVAVLFIVILVLVVFSAVSYQRSVAVQDYNNNLRAVLSYVITAVKADRGSEIFVSDADGMEVLTIRDNTTGYEQRIFHSDGKVCEDYGVAGSEINTEDALVIGEAKEFAISKVTDELIEIRTDLGNSYINIG